MASFRLLIKPSAAKELEAIPLKARRRMARRVQGLAEQPQPEGAERLTGLDLCRPRQGDDRVIAERSERDRTVTVFMVGHRREVYR